MSEKQTFKVQARTDLGKGANRRLRVKGLVPGVFPRALRAHPGPGMACNVPAVDQGVRAELRDGRGLRHRHVLPVWHQLGGVFRQGWPDHRPADGLRGADRFLP